VQIYQVFSFPHYWYKYLRVLWWIN